MRQIWSPVERAANKTLIFGLLAWWLAGFAGNSGLWAIWVGVVALAGLAIAGAVQLYDEHVKWVKFRRLSREISKAPETPGPWDDAPDDYKDPGW